MDKYFMYVRKSTEPLDRQKLSISAQIRENRERFPNITNVEVLEERHSAFIPERRPVFNEMMRRIQAGEAKGIICWHPDRLSRNEIDGAKITYQLRQGLDLKFANYHFEASPEGIMMLQMTFSHSQYSSAKLSFDVRRGNREKREQGGITWVPGAGYINNKVDHTIEPDPERFAVVRKMFDMALYSNVAPNRIAKTANEQWGYRTLGGFKLATSTIYKIFRNPLYAGFYITKSGTRYSCSHQAMISESEYWRLQIILGKKGREKPRVGEYAFAEGLIVCGECGSPLTVDRQRKNLKSGKTLSWKYYRCLKRNGPCNQKYTEERELARQILGFLDRTLLPDKFFVWLEKASADLEPRQATEMSSTENRKVRTIEDVNRELSNIITMRSKDFIDDETFIRRRVLLEGERSVLSAALVTSSDSWLEPLHKLREFSFRCRFWFENGTPEVQRTILTAVACSNLSLRNKKLHIRPVGPFAFGAKEAECAVWQGIGEDIRTFFLNNSGCQIPSLPTIQP